MRIVDLETLGPQRTDQAASLLVEGFAEHWPTAWPDVESAKCTVLDCLRSGWICRAAADGNGCVLGWCAAEPIYRGNVWEINVLVVRLDCQRQGIGRALLADLELQVSTRGGLTIW